MKKLYICLIIVLCSMKGFAQYSEYGGTYYDTQFGQTGVTVIYNPGPNWAAINAAQDAQNAKLAATVALNVPKQPVIPPPTGGITTSTPPKPSAPTPKPNIDPCAALAILNADTKYKERLNEIIGKAKTDSTKEYGYSISKGASNYVAGTNDSDGNLDFSNKNQIYGYMHDHTLPRATIGPDGLPGTTVYVQMFSSIDISTFLDALKYTATNGVAIADVFSTLVDNTGNVYTLKYEGTYNDIQGKSIDINALQDAYNLNFSDEGITGYGGIENAVAAFLELDVKIPGIVVYKTTPGTTPTKLGFTFDGTKFSPSNTPCK